MLDLIKATVPKKPGCYIYKNKEDNIIYIGKAKNLQVRMSSYFNRIHNIKTTKLVSEIKSFEFIITNNERESLLLENQLIKKHLPKYNIMLKDDKSYPYIVVTNDVHPQVLKVRNRKLHGKYYGPYPSSNYVNEIIKVINRITKLRKCRVIPQKECIYYHLNKCYAPCIINSSNEDIKMYKKEVNDLLINNMKGLKVEINNKMIIAADNLEFEEAGKYKYLIQQINTYQEKQAIDLNQNISFDVIEIYYDQDWVSITIIKIEFGMVVNIISSIHSYIEDYLTIVISYLYQMYEQNNSINFLTSNKELASMMENIFVMTAIKSNLQEYRNLEQMAKENARIYFKNNIEKIAKLIYDDGISGYDELKKITNNDLEIIEMYDISHLGGDAQVGVKVSYKKGKKDKKQYRKYKIKTASPGDEYGSMYEVIDRRISKMISENTSYPNLIILDGGKGQIKVCLEVLKKYSLDNMIMVMGLVKDKKHTTYAMMNKDYEQIVLKRSSKLYKFLYSIQEEVHRFAINYHHISKENKMIMSKLDSIEGLGPKRKQNLIIHFGSYENIKAASYDELIALKIPKIIVKKILKL